MLCLWSVAITEICVRTAHEIVELSRGEGKDNAVFSQFALNILVILQVLIG